MKKGDISFREFSDLLISSPIFILSFLAVFEKNCIFFATAFFLHFYQKELILFVNLPAPPALPWAPTSRY